MLVSLAEIAVAGAMLAGDRPHDALADPAFVLALVQQAGDAESVAQVLDFVRGTPAAPSGVTVREAVDPFIERRLIRYAPRSRPAYLVWLRRLVEAYGDRLVRSLTPADLSALIDTHKAAYAEGVAAGTIRPNGKCVAPGYSIATSGVTSLRALWRWLDAADLADARVAMRLVKPAKRKGNRRPYTREEAALVRLLAEQGGNDPLLDVLLILLRERALLRRVECLRLRNSDYDRTRQVLQIHGKGDQPREVPVTPGLAAALLAFLTDRCPRGVSLDEWCAREVPLLRTRRTRHSPEGRPIGESRFQGLAVRLRGLAPEVFASGALVGHSYRNTGASWIWETISPQLAADALGHDLPGTTTVYVFRSLDRLRRVLCAYERWLLGEVEADEVRREHGLTGTGPAWDDGRWEEEDDGPGEQTWDAA